MEPKGVRLACPDCTLDVVMTSESDCPPPVTKVVEGVPWCPNCNVPMKPIASVDTTLRDRALVTPKMTLEDIARLCADLETEAEVLANEVDRAKKVYSDKKKAYDGKVVTLRMAVERMGRLLGGEEIAADMPLLDIAEQPTDTRCPSVHDHEGEAVRCIGEVGHGGVHANGDVFWDPTVVEEAVALQASEVDDEAEPEAPPAEDEALPLPRKRGRRQQEPVLA